MAVVFRCAILISMCCVVYCLADVIDMCHNKNPSPCQLVKTYKSITDYKNKSSYHPVITVNKCISNHEFFKCIPTIRNITISVPKNKTCTQVTIEDHIKCTAKLIKKKNCTDVVCTTGTLPNPRDNYVNFQKGIQEGRARKKNRK
ncbi:uncharacterized protein [Onthophagus taurus]|uniref:uncharacterized protein isoform X2 n=1 Tax=Onthophagus taurus TaxID=166361 RepID=UPI000C206A84|nr:uncharacterized protein LOC111424229 isoform X2 [Onthophagus taurus]